MNKTLWTASCVCYALAAVFGLLSLVFRSFARKNLRYPMQTQAKVVEILSCQENDPENRNLFQGKQSAVIEYFAKGKLIKKELDPQPYPASYYIGETLSICYDPKKPEQFAFVEKQQWKWVEFGMHLAALAAVLAGTGLFISFAVSPRQG